MCNIVQSRVLCCLLVRLDVNLLVCGIILSSKGQLNKTLGTYLDRIAFNFEEKISFSLAKRRKRLNFIYICFLTQAPYFTNEPCRASQTKGQGDIESIEIYPIWGKILVNQIKSILNCLSLGFGHVFMSYLVIDMKPIC